MSNATTDTISVVFERDFAHPPEKVWRALTQPQLIEQWLMKNDFKPELGHKFKLSADWGAVDCEVLAIEPNRALSYRWNAYGLESVVDWTLSPTNAGTHVRMEQSGFRADQPQYSEGAKSGWQNFLDGLDQVLAKND